MHGPSVMVQSAYTVIAASQTQHDASHWRRKQVEARLGRQPSLGLCGSEADFHGLVRNLFLEAAYLAITWTS